MARGLPKSSKSDIAPIPAKRVKNVPLVAIGAFKVIAEREDKRTKEKYELEQVNLSLDFDSGYPIRDEEGELVLDEEGRAKPHLLNDGYVTLSGDKRANLIKILKALGFDDERFIDEEGNLTDEAAESLEVEFGVNGLGDDYAGADWDDLPLYTLPSRGGKDRKRDVEVPVLSMTILGYELLGRVCDATLTIKNGYNRVESYLQSEDFVDLDTPLTPVQSMSLGGPAKDAPAPPKAKAKRGLPAEKRTRKGVPQDETEVAAQFGDSVDPHNEPTPFDAAPVTKRSIYITRAMQSAGIPGKDRIALLQFILENEDVTSIADISLDDAKHFRALAEGPEAGDDPGSWLRKQLIELESRRNHPHLHDDDGEDWDDDDSDDDDSDDF